MPNCGTPRSTVAPDDPILFDLALGAGVLIRLAPGGRTYRGRLALQEVHKWCQGRVKFTWHDHAVWGFERYPLWAIVTTDKQHLFDLEEPSHLNCTLYANLMMSVWHQGNAHELPFNASAKEVGKSTAELPKRYHYRQSARYGSFEDIAKFTEGHHNRLFCLEPEFFIGVGHEALLFGDRIYECNPPRVREPIPLRNWLSGLHGSGWISGPSPD